MADTLLTSVGYHQMKHLLIFPLLAAALGGCSKQSGLSLSGTKASGDLVPLVMHCAMSRGGHATTNTLPVIQMSWTRQTRELDDIILMEGDHFSEVQKFLELAYGVPESGLGSFAVARIGTVHSLTYSQQQIGVVLNLTTDSRKTIVSVMGRQTP